MKKFCLTLLFVFMTVLSSSAFELDMSVDEEIRKTYDSSKLEYDVLPELPGVLLQQEKTQQPQNSIKSQIQTQTQTQPKTSDVPNSNLHTDYSNGIKIQKPASLGISQDSFTSVKIPKGTRFKVKSQTKVSDWNTAGARMTFVSTSPETKRYISFPVGTTFKGVIEKSHQPNFAGNGGLLKLKADSIILNGSPVSIDAKVTKADGKNIFFNNIKGKRGYAKGIASQVKKGEKFYNKTKSFSGKMSSLPGGKVLSVVPKVVGAVGYGVNVLISPVAAIGAKGTHITLPAGTDYTIKFRDDVYLKL